jgi:hypothetical protein
MSRTEPQREREEETSCADKGAFSPRPCYRACNTLTPSPVQRFGKLAVYCGREQQYVQKDHYSTLLIPISVHYYRSYKSAITVY